MENQQEEQGISLLQLIKVLFGRKVLLLLITIITTLVGSLAILLGYNKLKVNYIARFDYVIPRLETGKYIDGSKFDVRDVVSYDNLEDVKASSQTFKNIDIGNMFEKEKISLKKNSYKNEDTNEITYDYTISVSKKYFNSKEKAKLFIEAIASTPYDKTVELLDTVKYDSNLELFSKATIYDVQIKLLESQLELLDSKYDQLIEFYGNINLNEGRSIEDVKGDMDIYFTNYSLKNLYIEIEANGYVKDYENYSVELKLEKKDLQIEKEQNTAKINELQAKVDALIASAGNLQSVELTSYNNQIATFTVRNIDIDREIDIINKKLGITYDLNSDGTYKLDSKGHRVEIEGTNTVDTTEFEAKLEKYKNQLVQFTASYQSVEKEVVTNYSSVYFTYNNVIKETGGFSAIIAVGASLFMGLVIGCIVNLCLDYKKLNPNYVAVEPKTETKEENNEEEQA